MFDKIKCNECKWFEWEDEIPHCVFGIDRVQNIDDFNPINIHEKNTRCSIPTIEIQIKFNGPNNGNDIDSINENIGWFCPENICLILKKVCKNTDFEVRYSSRFEKKLNKMRKKLS